MFDSRIVSHLLLTVEGSHFLELIETVWQQKRARMADLDVTLTFLTIPVNLLNVCQAFFSRDRKIISRWFLECIDKCKVRMEDC